jgi:phosphatidylserine/phosphatidylglycerophosphate/cardiolipin synthase-like enzyme
MAITHLRIVFSVCLLVAISGCASFVTREPCPSGTQNLPDCPPLEAIEDPFINELYERRTWIQPDELDLDPIELGKQAEIPVQHARTKFLGATSESALNALAVKIWLIENARHTIDATYYIFKRDLIGEAMLGALCNAVQRGVDIRFMVDSLGSMDVDHTELKALETCAASAGFMRNADGELTTKKARVQVIIFNAISKVFINANRRSHDKLLVVDGSFAGRAVVITGGRNISLSYYGINADGSPNPDTYMDAEILLRTGESSDPDERTVGQVSEIYYSLLFHFVNNKRLRPRNTDRAREIYASDRQIAQAKLAELKAIPVVRQHYDAMPVFLAEGWYDSRVLLAHEFGNLTNKNVFTDAVSNLQGNPNSIHHLLRYGGDRKFKRLRIVSPYLFATQYYDDDGVLVVDGARDALDYLEENPDTTLEIITNSVLTSDNFPAQSVIDMNMAPRLLLSEEMQAAWLDKREESELNPGLVESEEWRKLVNHPRLMIYETGRLDDRQLGGDVDYGKLHAKYIIIDDGGFVGTTNFDYRSRLRNNEMGFFFESAELAQKLHDDFDLLKSRSYRWGSPEWLQMRRGVFELGGIKGHTAKSQRAIYKTLRATGLDKQF